MKYTCPCCGYQTFSRPPGSFEICPVCYWEDELVALRWPQSSGGANKVSLIEGQKNFEEFGACERKFLQYVRQPNQEEPRDPKWRKIDFQKDSFKELDMIQNNKRESYPDKTVELYYWLNN